jgi:potassium-transporting ATPase KdpC subunit
MRRQLLPALVAMVVFSVLFGLVYPLVVTAVAQVAFNDQANGSLVEVDGEPVGSSLMGQAFADADGNPLPEYFQPRPSMASGAEGTSVAGYDPTLSLGSNLGPTNPCLVPMEGDPCLDDAGEEIPPAVVERVAAYRELNGLDDATPVPVDAVTASASGLDPDISVANARLQAARVAEERGLEVDAVLALVEEHTTSRTLGILGEDRVNVLELNLALDALAD